MEAFTQADLWANCPCATTRKDASRFPCRPGTTLHGGKRQAFSLLTEAPVTLKDYLGAFTLSLAVHIAMTFGVSGVTVRRRIRCIAATLMRSVPSKLFARCQRGKISPHLEAFT